jgi:hypothetical protein
MTIEGVDKAKGVTKRQNAAGAKEQGKVTHGHKRASGSTVSVAATTGK